MIKAVLFDMDGLMFDTESAYSIVQEHMFARRGSHFTLDLKSTLMGKRASDVMSLLNQCWGRHESVDDLLREQDEELVTIYNEQVEKMPGLNELLTFLDTHGVRKCIGTSSRRFLVELLLKKHGLEYAFEFVVSGDDVQNGKPHPEIYSTCLERLHLPGSATLVLEDSHNGVLAGNAAGAHTCAIPSTFTSHEDFSVATMRAVRLDDPSIQKFIMEGVL